MTRVLVTGAGGFIGHHLVKYLRARGNWVCGIDVKKPEFEATDADWFIVSDLRHLAAATEYAGLVDEVYHLAADMGGMGYIAHEHASVAINNALIDANMLRAAAQAHVKRFFYASSACVYPTDLQNDPNFHAADGLSEDHAWPAMPDEGYGLEKLFGEKLCQYASEDLGLLTRVARFHNVYGPLGTYDGGKEKAPAAICRKVAAAPDGGEIEVWGDGRQTRSFMYIDDCVEGIHRIMRSDYREPLNLGTEEMVSINALVEMVAGMAGKRVTIRHVDGPQGVRGRNSDNSRLRSVLGWEPQISLGEGLSRTYPWIAKQVGMKAADAIDRKSRHVEA